MAETIAILTLTIMATLMLGILLGRKSERDVLQQRLDETYKRAKAEAEEEKAKFSLSLSEELGKVREGIVKSVEAYDSVVRLVEDRLPTPTTGAVLKIDDRLSDHLLIPFHGQGINEAPAQVNEQDAEIVHEAALEPLQKVVNS